MDFPLSSYKPYTNKQGVTTAGCLPFDSTLEDEIMSIIDGSHEPVISALRGINDRSEKHKYKAANLHCFTASVICRAWRNTENIVNHTGLICIDIDGADNPSMEPAKLRDEIFKMPECAASFVSASGNGVAAIFHIIPGHHVPCFETLQGYFKTIGVTVDSKCVDLVRLRFTSYDSGAKYRPDPELLMPDLEYINKRQQEEFYYTPNALVNSYANFLNGVRFANKRYEFKVGSRHWHLMHIASYCNHIGMTRENCERFTIQHYQKQKISPPQIKDLADSDLLEPIRNVYRSYKKQFATMKPLPKPYTIMNLKWLLNLVSKDLLRENIYKFGRETFIGGKETHTVESKFSAFFMHLLAPDMSWTILPGHTAFTNKDIKNNVPDNAYLDTCNGSRVWCCKTNKIPLSWL